MRSTQRFLVIAFFLFIQTNLISQTVSNNTFNFDFYQKLSQADKKENIFYSPFSISTAFSVPYAGAEGLTKTQLEKVFRYDANSKRNLKDYYKLSNRLERADDVTLRIANSLWIEETKPFEQAFLKTTKTLTGKANIYKSGFSKNFETVRGDINSWISNSTNGTIRSLLEPGSLNALTSFVMANAIYFKGNWEIPFDKELTATNEFYGLNGEVIPTQFMTKKVEKHRYYEDDEVQVLELGYEGRDISMIMVLPRFADNFSQIQSSLTANKYDKWINGISSRPVVVTIPKFQMNVKYDLRSTLRKMGLKDPFTENANFSEISKTPLRISKVMHQAFLQVDEIGTEASASTAIVGTSKGGLVQKPAFFNANQPFMFFIVDRKTNAILFTGRLTKPNYDDAKEYSETQPVRFPVMPIPVTDEVHWVKKGETLFAVSRLYNVPVQQIVSLNSLTSNNLQVDQKLLIKEGVKGGDTKPTIVVDNTESTPTTKPKIPVVEPVVIKKETRHIVSKGESLFAISRKYKIGVEEIKHLNNMTSNIINIGQELVVSKTAVNASESIINNSKGLITKEKTIIKQETINTKYTVKKGDTLWKIAHNFSLSVDKIKSLNNMNSNVINIGQELILNN